MFNLYELDKSTSTQIITILCKWLYAKSVNTRSKYKQITQRVTCW